MEQPRYPSSSRMVAIVLAMGIVLAALLGTGSLAGLADPTPSQADSSTTVATGVAAGAPATWVSSSTTLPSTTAAPPTTAAAPPATVAPPTTAAAPPTTSTTLPLFTKARPLRLLAVGDSLATYPGYALERQMEVFFGLQVLSITKQSSGLCRPDYYNWPQVLAETVADFHPHITVVLLGANDNQPVSRAGRSLKTFSDEWKAEYARRIDNLIQIATTAGSSVIWVGLPIMKSRAFSETERKLNELYEAGCAARPGALYIDGYTMFTGADGLYASRLTDPSGQTPLMRARDGIHFTMDGAGRIADAVVEVLLSRFRLERSPVAGASE